MSLLMKFKALREQQRILRGAEEPVGDARAESPYAIAPRSSPAPDPALLIDAYHERFAVCLEAGDMTENEARAIAENEVGADLNTLATCQIQIWRASLETVVNTDNPWVARVAQSCLADLEPSWCFDAAKLGWTEEQLFGMHQSSPRMRIEAMGLIVSMACTALKGPLSVISVDAADARILTGAGGRLIHQRFRPSLGPPIWLNPILKIRNGTGTRFSPNKTACC